MTGQTEVSMAWLDRVVTAHQRLTEANRKISELIGLMRRGNDESNLYDPRCDDALLRDGTGHRLHALRQRVATIEYDLRQAECHGTSVGPILVAATVVLDVLTETVLATELLLEEAGNEPPEDPFIDRLEEHPAYERN